MLINRANHNIFMITQIEIDIITKLVLAAFLGGVVGFQRELHGNPAGTRTQSLICMGAALFTLLPAALLDTDLLRLAGGVVTGVGFLAAGIIFRSQNSTHGLTTAAEVWVIAAVGIAIGIGRYYAAIVATIIILIILGPLKAVENIEKKHGKTVRK